MNIKYQEDRHPSYRSPPGGGLAGNERRLLATKDHSCQMTALNAILLKSGGQWRREVQDPLDLVRGMSISTSIALSISPPQLRCAQLCNSK